MPFDSTLDPTTDVILGAIDYLEKHEWCQGTAMRGIARCLLSTLTVCLPPPNTVGAGPEGSDSSKLMQATRERVERSLGIREHHLTEWNDVPGRTKEQVIDALHASLGGGIDAAAGME
jgi:hypothetical protein